MTLTLSKLIDKYGTTDELYLDAPVLILPDGRYLDLRGKELDEELNYYEDCVKAHLSSLSVEVFRHMSDEQCKSLIRYLKGASLLTPVVVIKLSDGVQWLINLSQIPPEQLVNKIQMFI